ncbi:hypothetical protein [Halopiger goleimassiliensis]|uniref:hypothetical protein n=1 Tax=Halopiger goleimassiliensis TaxID=1293048 RepID=UPI000677AA5F|nr:hypothetical protein [Halopiger goleimassiliensis]
MTQNTHEEVTEILEDADRSTRSLVSADDGSGPSLQETAARASEFLESNAPEEILDAVGLNTLPDGSEPDSIPEAIARGDDEDLEELNRLLHLAKLTETADEESLEATAGTLREHVDDERTEADGETGDEAGDETESDETETDEAGDESETPAEEEEEDGSLIDTIAGEVTGSDEGGDEDESDLGDALGSALESSLTEFGDEMQGLRDRLEAARSDTESNGERDEDGEGEASDDGDEPDEDDGLLGMDVGGDDRRSSSRGVVRHSTMAPPPSKRPDMKGTARHSTMPDRNG